MKWADFSEQGTLATLPFWAFSTQNGVKDSKNKKYNIYISFILFIYFRNRPHHRSSPPNLSVSS
jgi:hypothetical protein